LLEQIQNLVQLMPAQMVLCTGVVFAAGMVRGFAGFALSALIMASLALILPPIELIPICYVLEATASLMMFRGGMRDADMKIVWGLTIGSVIGVPMGLYATTVLPVETSKLVALCLILGLASAQLLRVRPKFLARTPGLYASGVTAGVVSGLASVGGLVVALYVLARDVPARTMRASLVTFLFIGMFTTIVYQLGFGVMNKLAFTRGLLLSPVVVVGVLLGSTMFRPSLEGAYKKFCLGLLIFLAAAGLLRLAF
jgi:uncharacterized protein